MESELADCLRLKQQFPDLIASFDSLDVATMLGGAPLACTPLTS